MAAGCCGESLNSHTEVPGPFLNVGLKPDRPGDAAKSRPELWPAMVMDGLTLEPVPVLSVATFVSDTWTI